MTVTYSYDVSQARLCGFAKLLFRWKGSIYKLLYREMIIFMFFYYALSATYRFGLNGEQREFFEKVALYCEKFTDLIPLSFVLGFYVTLVVGRWWSQYMAIPWPDKTCMLISLYIRGTDDRSRMLRRQLARYLVLMAALTFQAISPAVKKRFPTIDHLVEAGLMSMEESRMYNEVVMPHGKYWVPAQWFGNTLAKARREGRIKDGILYKHLVDELHIFRANCGLIFSYDWISIPLVYTQVVTLAIYTYFLATIMGRQYLDPAKAYPGHEIELYVPVFTLLQFFFYIGWLKVAEQLINPFGEDDDDFELNWCLDRDLQYCYNVVDALHQQTPPLVKDTYWDEVEAQLPYTKGSVNLRNQPHLGSAMRLNVNLEESEFVAMGTIMEEDKHKYCSRNPSPTFDRSGSQNDDLGNSNQADVNSSSNSRFKFSDFPRSRLFNLILGSNRDVSPNTDTMNETTTPRLSNTFISRKSFRNQSTEKSNKYNSATPNLPKILLHHKSSADQSPLVCSDDKEIRSSADQTTSTVDDDNVCEKFCSTFLPQTGLFDQQLTNRLNQMSEFSKNPPSPIQLQQEEDAAKTPDILFPGKEHFAIKVPALSLVEEESHENNNSIMVQAPDNDFVLSMSQDVFERSADDTNSFINSQISLI